MQVDMHYYATYALARAGGFTKEDSRIIATARSLRRRKIRPIFSPLRGKNWTYIGIEFPHESEFSPFIRTDFHQHLLEGFYGAGS